jgi:hypothetical protein
MFGWVRYCTPRTARTVWQINQSSTTNGGDQIVVGLKRIMTKTAYKTSLISVEKRMCYGMEITISWLRTNNILCVFEWKEMQEIKEMTYRILTSQHVT